MLYEILFWVSVIVFMLLTLLAISDESAASDNMSLDDNRRLGQWRVLYNDGAVSQPMFKKTAQDYASIFGGIVVKVVKKE